MRFFRWVPREYKWITPVTDNRLENEIYQLIKICQI
jgi:hypothetical protein